MLVQRSLSKQRLIYAALITTVFVAIAGLSAARCGAQSNDCATCEATCDGGCEGACATCALNVGRKCNRQSGPCSCRYCAKKMVTGVDSGACLSCGEPNWSMRGPIPWDLFAHGEYLGPHRTPHVPVYRIRVNDQLEFVYRLTRVRSGRAYQLNVGDQIRVESLADEKLDRELEIQPDGSITVRLIGQVMAAGLTTDELRVELEKRYKKFYRVPSITVTPIVVNTRLEDIRATVDSRQGVGGQSRRATVTPEGTIQLPAIGSVKVLGLTLEEVRMEVEARYSQLVDGLGVTPVLTQRAPRFIYVVGEVVQGGRFELVGPTTVTQAIALAQGWNVGANLNQVVIFRRAHDWRLIATKVDIRGALFGRRPAPSDELWLRDSDVVIVPKTPIKSTSDAIDLIFARGIYQVVPFLDGTFFNNFSTVTGI